MEIKTALRDNVEKWIVNICSGVDIERTVLCLKLSEILALKWSARKNTL